MTDAQLDAIEAVLGVVLPPEYRRVSQEFPFHPVGRDCVYWFFDTPDAVVCETLAPLADGGYERVGPWDAYLVIGRSPAGDLFILDMAAVSLPVLLLSHETHAIEPAWPTFGAYVEEWRTVPEGIAGESSVGRNRSVVLTGIVLLAVLALPMLGLFFVWLMR